MTSLITFTDCIGVSDDYVPVPATQIIPDWYKNTPEYVHGERVVRNGNTPHTVKKCIPVFDAMTAGYIISTPADVQVTQQEGYPWYEWPSVGLGFHPVEQAPDHPAKNGASYPKWINPWAIRTPPGYSCLFISPMHNPNGVFTVLPGVVDTDTYTAMVNFPFVLDDVSWEGLIPAGTPMVQVIPFKRESWKMTLGDDRERKAQAKTTTRLRSVWFNSYKRQFWTRKEYR